MSDQITTRIARLMLIDDNRVDQMMYKRIINRTGVAQQVICFSQAEEALAYLTADPENMPDMILLDINMPRMDGFEFLEAANAALGAGFCVVVVMLTTSLDPRDIERAQQFDVVKEYLDKPLTTEKVQELATLL